MKLYKPLVLCGPSGSGKSTLTNHLLEIYPNKFKLSVSSTTRGPRQGEQDGVHYFFWKKEKFESEIQKGGFLEWNKVHGNIYGTHKQQVLDTQKAGQICVLDIDVQGSRDIHDKSGIDCEYMFLYSPIDVLEQRLRNRGSETEETLRTRLENATKDEKLAKELGIFSTWIESAGKEKFLKDCDAHLKKVYGL